MSGERSGEANRSVDDILAGLDRARKNFESLQKQSIEAAKLYGDFASYAGRVISSVDDTRRYLEPLRPPEVAGDPTITPILERIGTDVSTLVVHSESMVGGFTPLAITREFVYTNMGTAVSSSTGLYEISKGLNSVAKYLFPEKVDVPALDVVEESRGDAGAEVDAFLGRLDERFVRMRRGVWSTLQGTSANKLMEAGHMARELLAQVLQMLAPDGEISKATWFPKGNGVTRKHRVRFILSGSGTGRSESEEEVTIQMMKTSDALYGKLSGKFAHAHEDIENVSKEALLKSFVRMTEEVLLIFLRHRFPAV